MALNYIQPGDQALDLIAPAGGVTSGLPVRLAAGVGKIVIPLGDAAAAAEFRGATEGVYSVPKEAPLVIGPLVDLYWDDTAKKATTTATNNIKLGHSIRGAASADTFVEVRLTP